MHYLLILITTSLVMLTLDGLWIALVAHPAYVSVLANQLRSFTHVEPLVWLSVILVYVLIVSGFMVFIFPRIKDFNFMMTALYAGYFGLVVYGVFAMTNFAILQNWTITLMLLDTCWGAILYGTTACIIKLIFKNL